MIVFAFNDLETGERRIVIGPNETEIARLPSLIQKVSDDERAAYDAMLEAIPVGRAKVIASQAFSKVATLKERYEKLVVHRRLLQQIALQAASKE